MAATTNIVRSPSRINIEAAGIHNIQQNFTATDIIGQGYLTKIGQRWKSLKRRWFVITFQDVKYYENRDKYEAHANPLGSISVADIQSIQPSNALNFGENTSLSIRTKNRALEVGDQKELVADGILFVLQRWVTLRASNNALALAPSLSIPVIEMPAVLQREVQRHFDELPIDNYVDLLQEPAFLYSWTAQARDAIVSEFSGLFASIFGAPAAKAQENLAKYILLHQTWTHEIVIYYNSQNKIRRVCVDPEPLLHYISDHFASINKVDLSHFDEFKGATALIECLKRLREDYQYVLPELVLPTHLKRPEEVDALAEKFFNVMEGASFQTTASSATNSEKVLSNDGSYLLRLFSNPSRGSTAFRPISADYFVPAPSSMQTMDMGMMRAMISDSQIQAISSIPSAVSSTSEDVLTGPASMQTMDEGVIRALGDALKQAKTPSQENGTTEPSTPVSDPVSNSNISSKTSEGGATLTDPDTTGKEASQMSISNPSQIAPNPSDSIQLAPTEQTLQQPGEGDGIGQVGNGTSSGYLEVHHF